MTQTKKDYRRTNILIDPKFQLTITGYFAGLAFLAVFVLFWSTHAIFSDIIERVQASGIELKPAVLSSLLSLESRAVTFMTVGSFVVFVLLIVGGIVLSFRIAGPIFHLRKHMRNVASGGPCSKVTFRKDDFFEELAEDYNSVLERFAGDVKDK